MLLKVEQAEWRLCQSGTASDFIVIDPDFERLIPPLTVGELAKLHRSLDAEGCRDALLVWFWEGRTILVDGHNRLRYCRLKGYPYSLVLLEFADREAVERCILDVQAGRRNLSALAFSYNRGQRYLGSKRQGQRTSCTCGNSYQKSTAERLGEEFGVGEKTIRNDARLAEALDRIVANCGVAASKLLLTRDSGATHRCVLRLARLAPQEQQRFVEQMQANDGKVQRQKRVKGRRPERITIPLQPEALVQTLRKHFNAEELAGLVLALSDRNG